jgi:transcriptional enhancer factor
MDQSSTCGTYDVDRSYRSSVPADGIFSSNGVTNVFRPSSHPRPICTIDPTITFVSQSAISAQSSCSVLLDGETVHTEVTPLTLTGSCPDGPRTVDCPLLYGVQLVPNYWQYLCQSPSTLYDTGKDYLLIASYLDITRYTIVQHVTRFSSFSQSEGAKENSLMFSAVYHFSYPRRTDEPASSPSPTHDIRNNESYSFTASNLDNRLSNSWYSDLLSPADVRALSYTPDANVEHQLTMSEGSEECDRSVGSFSEDANAVSPISSCFPADLSNYIV